MNEYIFMIGTLGSIVLFFTTFIILLWLRLYHWAMGFVGGICLLVCFYNSCRTRPKKSFTHQDIKVATDEIHHINPDDIKIVHKGGEYKGGEYKGGEYKGEYKGGEYKE